MTLGIAFLAPGSASAKYLTIGEYRDLAQAAARNEKGADDTLLFFFGAFWNMVVAKSEAEVKAGVKPVFCLPRRASWPRLREEIDAELAAQSAYWNKRNDDSIGALTLIVIKRRWPCK